MLNITQIAAAEFSITEAQATLQPLALFVVGVVIYSVFVFKFYRFIARKNIFKLHLSKYSEGVVSYLKVTASLILYGIEYLIIFPLFTFFWFAVIAVILILMSKQDVTTILLISMSLVGGVRITAYYNEDLSKDLAKMLPFALLGIFLLDVSFFSFDKSLEVIKSLPTLWKIMVYYLAFAMSLEFVLRIGYTVIHPIMIKTHEEMEDLPPDDDST